MSVDDCRRFLKEDCTRSQSGRLISRRSGRPVTAVVPVHLYGQMADMDPILDLADQYGLTVIEDACQAHGAEYFSKRFNRWMKAGSMGRAAAFSFYPGKNLGACGEAGAVTTNDAAVADRIKMLRDHGQAKKYYHDMEGYNGRLDAIQAGLLARKAALISQSGTRSAATGRRNTTAFWWTTKSIIRPYEPSWSRAVYHLYVIRTGDRDGMMEHLKEAGIGTGIHYPVPLHLQKAYAWMNYDAEDFPVTSRVAGEIVSLPMFPQLTFTQQAQVVREIDVFTSKLLSRQVASEPISLAAELTA